jgi:hypothetical protein
MNDLRKRLRALAAERKLQFLKHSEYHVQIRDKATVLVDIWPHKLKARPMHPIHGKTQQYQKSLRLVQAVTRVLDEYHQFQRTIEMRQALAEQQIAARRQRKQSQAMRAAVKRAVRKVSKPRIAGLGFDLEETQLRVVLNSPQFSDSWRLSPDDTRELLQRAHELYEELLAQPVVG